MVSNSSVLKVSFCSLVLVMSIGVLLIFKADLLRSKNESNTTTGTTSGIYTSFNRCKVPSSGGFKGWDTGVVTVMKPEIKKNCRKAFAGNKLEIARIRNKKKDWKNALTDEEFHTKTKNCSWVRNYFQDNLYTTQLERSFPLGFSFVMYENPQQVIRLFKVLYRSHNTYCFHPDKKSDRIFSEIFSNVAACLSNVFVASKREKVVWGHFSLMEAQMNCLADLVKRRKHQSEAEKWKYVVNLCGKELPLTTNHEIVSRLMELNGSSAIDAHKVGFDDKGSWRRLHKKKIPFNLPYYKAMTYMGISYDFAHFLLTNQTALKLREFFRGCKIPEEHFYATLYMVPGVPGGYNSQLKSKVIVSLYFWVFNSAAEAKCKGLLVHNICIVSIGDLQRVMRGRNHSLFHNKYFAEHDHTIMDCAEERLVELNREEFRMECGDIHS